MDTGGQTRSKKVDVFEREHSSGRLWTAATVSKNIMASTRQTIA